jgi:uncharacterized protein (TIGR04255 family)
MSDELHSLQFTNLPLIEVSARLVFESGSLDLSLGKIVKLAGALNGWFSTIDQPMSFEATPKGTKIERGKLVSVAFSAQDPSIQLSVQNDMLKWSWTRGASPNSGDYPRYKQLRKEIFWFANAALANLAEAKVSILSLNMGYTNFIPSPGPTPQETVLKYLSEPMRARIVESGPYFHEIMLNWREPGGLDRKLQFLNGTAQTPAGKGEGCLFATNVGSFTQLNNPPEDTLDIIHKDLQDFFLSAITETAKREWGYVKRS